MTFDGLDTVDSPLARWVQELRGRVGVPADAGVGPSLAIRMLAQKGLEVPRRGYDDWRARLLARIAAGPGTETDAQQLGAELVASAALDGPERVAIIELDGCPLQGVLLAAPGGSGHDYVIALPRAFSTFAHLLAKSCALAVPIEVIGDELRIATEGDWADALVSGAPAVGRFIELLEATAGGWPASAPRYLAPAERGGIVSAMRDAMKLMTIGRHLAAIEMLVLDGVELERSEIQLAPDVSVVACASREVDRTGAVLAALALTLRTRTYQDAAPFSYWGIEMLLDTVGLLQAIVPDTDRALSTFLGPETREAVGVCRYGLMQMRGPDAVELDLAQEMAPVRDALLAAAETWAASRPAA
jgi:hypothetical protein